MLPNKDELKIIDEAIAATNAAPEVAAKLRPAIIKAFDAAEFTTDQIDLWLVVSKEKLPDLWGATLDPAQAERNTENAALALTAFEGRGNVDARGRLVKAVGEAEANKLAKAHGLKSVADFTSVGKAPAADDDEGEDDDAKAKAKAKGGDKPSSNPWSPKYKGTEGEKQAERVRIIRVMGSKAAARMSAACHVDLAGRPLRSRVA